MTDDVNDYETYREYCFDHKPKRCEICGDEETGHVHHLDGDRNNNKIENLVPLCPSHHSRIHWGHEEYSEYVKHLPMTSLNQYSSTKLSINTTRVLLIERILLTIPDTETHEISVDKTIRIYLPTYGQKQGKTLIDEMLKDRSSPIEGYGSGRENIRLTSVEAAVEYLKDNDGNVPFGYD